MSAAPVVRAISCQMLIGRPVRSSGVLLGRVADLLLSPDRARVFGFEVDCEAGERRFLPLAACDVEETELTPLSPHALVDALALPYYRGRGQSFRALVGARMRGGETDGGRLEDILITSDGEVECGVVRTGPSDVRLEARLAGLSNVLWDESRG